MLRTFVCALFGLVLFAGIILADEMKGKITKVDAEKKTVTVSVDGKDKDLKVGDDTKILNSEGKDLKDGLKSKDLHEGAEVTVQAKDDMVSEIKLKGKKKDKKDK